MIRGRQSAKTKARGAVAAPAEELPYAVELWNLTRTGRERVIARAANITLARAIFAAACSEHLGRRLVLSRAGQILQQTD